MKRKKCITDTRRLRKPAWAVLLLLLLCVVFGLAYLRYAKGYRTFQPPEFEWTAAEGEPETTVNFQQLAVREGFLMGLDVEPEVRDSCIYLNAVNYEGNDIRFLVKVYQNDELIGRTGIVEPGKFVERVACERQPAPGDEVFLKFVAYELDGWHSEGVANVVVTVSSGQTTAEE